MQISSNQVWGRVVKTSGNDIQDSEGHVDGAEVFKSSGTRGQSEVWSVSKHYHRESGQDRGEPTSEEIPY